MTNYLSVAVGLSLLLSGAEAGNSITVDSTTALAGEHDVLVQVFADNDIGIVGLAFAGEYDAGLTLDSMTVDGTIFGPGELEADYVCPIAWGSAFGAAILIELPGSMSDPYDAITLPSGTDRLVLRVYFDVDAGLASGTILNLDLRDDVRSTANPSSPTVDPVFTVAAAESLPPELIDGSITIVAPPMIASVSPVAGSVDGGTVITLSGSDFTADTAITIGGLALENVEFISDSEMRGTTPAHPAGTVGITVTNGIGSHTLEDVFTYEEVPDPPTIVSVAPNTGRGEVDVTITGTNFIAGDTTVLVGGSAATEIAVVSATELTCHFTGCGGSLDVWLPVQVTTSGGSDTLPEGYFCQGLTDFSRGDVNQDGTLDLSDGISVLLYLFGFKPEPGCLKSADVNDDALVNIADAVAALAYLYAGGEAPPEPFPGCGLDPTADSLTCSSHSPCEP